MNAPRGNFHVLLLILLLLVVVLPFLSPGPIGRIILNVLVGCLFVTSVLSFLRRRRLKAIGITLTVASLTTGVLSNVAPSQGMAIARQSLTSLFLAFTAAVLLGAVLSRGRVDANKISGSVCVFLLMGFVWSGLFSITELVSPGSIQPAGETTQVLAEHLRYGDPDTSMTYFSFVTLTTLGYGDMLPVSRVARMLAWVEAVFGQLYLTILVAWLVGMYMTHSQNERKD
jgi:hypothetical protein